MRMHAMFLVPPRAPLAVALRHCNHPLSEAEYFRKRFHPVKACIALFALLLPAAQASAAAPPAALSAMDYIEIQQLVNRLNFALDYCTQGGRDFADLFAEGGQFVIDEGDGKPRAFSTREQLIGVAGGPDCKAIQTPPRSYVLHLAESLVIEPSAGGATGKSYAIYPANKGKIPARRRCGTDGSVSRRLCEDAAGLALPVAQTRGFASDRGRALRRGNFDGYCRTGFFTSTTTPSRSVTLPPRNPDEPTSVA